MCWTDKGFEMQIWLPVGSATSTFGEKPILRLYKENVSFLRDAAVESAKTFQNPRDPENKPVYYSSVGDPPKKKLYKKKPGAPPFITQTLAATRILATPRNLQREEVTGEKVDHP